MDQGNSNHTYQQQEEAPKKLHPLHALIPKGEYFFTPIILNINILVFVAMVASGVSPIVPDGEALIHWGANYMPLTVNGEPWRLFTSMFLHFGIIHLATNMYALYSIGRMLEPFIGKNRFLLLYLFAGLGGSAVSLWWHSNSMSVAAGASGAIFGLFGVFAALLTTNLIEQTVRKQLMKSMAMAIGLNLMIGLYAGIDNSAHIGGLMTGAMGGWLSYFDLKSWYHHRVKKYTGLIISGCLTVCAIIFFWVITPKISPMAMPLSESEIQNILKRADAEESRALNFWDKMDSTTTTDEFQKNVSKPWQHYLAIIDTMQAQQLNEQAEKTFPKLRKYVLWRLKGAEYYERSQKEKRPDLRDSANAIMKKADNTITEINEELKEKK
ncbi:MAG: rhomboid family intramembrane serine protease [Bacteroidetes bacterium]|jgi:rhomboid protease GluP|nr:rhomboid family intramembrane serine protease [Bacteroidota bacterium]